MPRRSGPPRDRKRPLIDAVIQEVVEHGIANTSTTSIGKAAGISKSVIHYHFANLAALYSAAFEVVMREAGEMMRVRVLQEQLPGRRLRQIVWGALPLTDVGRRRATFWFNVLAEALSDPKLLEIQRDYTSSWLRFVTGCLEDLQRDGHLRPSVDPVVLADAIVAFADGLSFRLVFGPPISEAALERAVEDFFSLLAAVPDPEPGAGSAPPVPVSATSGA